MKRIEVEITKYPSLHRLFVEDKQEFARIFNAMLTHADHALSNKRFENSDKYYKMDYIDMVNDVMDTFFDLEGLAGKHPVKAEKEALKYLGHNLHPLAIFTNNAPTYNAKGENVSPGAYLEENDFNLKNWLYSLFYGARFVSWQELSEYLTLRQYDLIDVLKARNFEQLAAIQEDLQTQENKGIPKGKLIPGTGKLDLGEANENA